ncbi:MULTISPECIES: hypothetical protein [unclassified Devosia]|mgnify:CR=1 FL=1|jgi:hypothetical protein|uniref:hypothetical protein n=1 Tax=unclassified Devosia TaxID=196773 RepID=UPI00086C9D62|nr:MULTISPECIES: hypothetical protein [unclassified Devosia]MBN9361745.1 hypothetical protein [Devosia sp.]ODS87635.1 MAG: hypothetical protein ABS47_11920 [Devosia sp. SCN 66-27]OJX26774.1 MAG: hypothetical protein BGO83_23295 [Devosia sp. 66-14]
MIRPALLALLVLGAAPAAACETWTAGMMDDEGGQIFTASACATDLPDAYLLLTCSAGEVFLRYDLAAGGERSPDLGEVTDVDFTVGISTQRLSMNYQEMDGLFAGEVPANGPLMALLKSGEALTVVDADGRYPVHSFGLAGSSSALTRLVRQCN